MKYYIGLLFIFFTSSILGQNTVKMSAVKSNNYGVAYSLPTTVIKVTATVKKETRKMGEFYQYAERYLNIANPIVANETIYSLDKIEAYTMGIPDKLNSYLVEFKVNTTAPFVTLTEDGVICAINDDVVILNETKTTLPTSIKTDTKPKINPKSILSEEILRAGSTAKQAELIAKQIYLLRDSRTNILTGEAENMPPDGNAYKMIMEQIDANEEALMSLFIGTETSETITKEFTVDIKDSNIDKKILFRFSSKLGIVDTADLAGAPVYLSLTNKEPKQEEILTEKELKAIEKKFASGIVYNIPGKANLKIEFNNKTFVDKTCDIIQYGKQDVLVTKMFENNKQPVKVIFYLELGAIKQIIQ